MKRLLFGWLTLLLVRCASIPSTESSMPKPATLPDLGPAPELSNDTWLNVEAPLRLTDLRGKVVLVDFWTFG